MSWLLPEEFAELLVAVEVVGEVEVELLNPDAAWFKLARVAARPKDTRHHTKKNNITKFSFVIITTNIIKIISGF